MLASATILIESSRLSNWHIFISGRCTHEGLAKASANSCIRVNSYSDYKDSPAIYLLHHFHCKEKAHYESKMEEGWFSRTITKEVSRQRYWRQKSFCSNTTAGIFAHKYH